MDSVFIMPNYTEFWYNHGMSSLFVDYRDPLFGIMAFLLISLVIALLSMLLAKLKGDKEARRIKRFLQNFPANSEAGDYIKLLEAHPGSFELLSKVAKAHFDGGDFERSLKIYLALLEWVSPFEKAKRAQILERLGDIYTKSGFLQRSVDAYEQSLSLVARNQSALAKIVLIYEKRGDYSKAMEALEALEEMGMDEDGQKQFLGGLIALKEARTFDAKLVILESLCHINTYFAREYLRELLLTDQKKAQEFLEKNISISFLDILWNFQLDADMFKTSKHKLIRGVLQAKGIVGQKEIDSGLFELDTIIAAKIAKPELKADLNFEFVCKKCGALDIDYFFSCKSCAAMGECVVLPKISEKNSDAMTFLESW